MNFSKEELKSLGKRFCHFIKSSAPFFFIFSLWFGGAVCATILLVDLLEFINVSEGIRITIMRILLTIAPFFPTLYLWNGRDEAGEEDIEGTTMNCCFMAWIAIIIFVWNI